MTSLSARSALSEAIQSYFDSLVSGQFLAAEAFAESIEALQAESEATTPEYVVFYYEIDEIIDTISMISHYKAKNIKSQEKEPKGRLDELTLTDDELEMVMKLLREAAKDVYKEIAAYGKGIVGGYIFHPDVTEPVEYADDRSYDAMDLFYVDDQLYYTIADDTPAGTDPEDTDYFTPVGEEYNTYRKIIYSLLYDSNMDTSMIQVLNDDLAEAIEKHVILGWYKMIQEASMIPLAKEDYEEAISKVKRSAWYRKTITRRRTELI